MAKHSSPQRQRCFFPSCFHGRVMNEGWIFGLERSWHKRSQWQTVGRQDRHASLRWPSPDRDGEPSSVPDRGVQYWKKMISRYFWGFFDSDILPSVLLCWYLSTVDSCGFWYSSYSVWSVLGLQKVGKFPVNFGNFPEILETFRDFWKCTGIFGKFPEIYHPFATLVSSHQWLINLFI